MSDGQETRKYEPLLSGKSDQELEVLCQELRSSLVESVSQTGGHLSPNLGVVELTVALHRVFDTRYDRLVFDVGHQSYVHKMLTGRWQDMKTLRQYGGIAGFPKPSESVHDAFIAGHASNSVAVAAGMAQARSLQLEDYRVIALIGDGALTWGLAYEGLSNGGFRKEQLLVILNDNGMSITPNVGGVAQLLSKQRMNPKYLKFKQNYRKFMHKFGLGRGIYAITHSLKKALKQSILPCSMFENLGFTYLGPVDGHDLHQLTESLGYAASLREPVLLHVRTQKGKGYLPAQENPDAFHGVSPFDPRTGKPRKPSGQNFSAVFGETLCELAEQNDKVCALTAAMVSGTGLVPFAKRFPNRFFDVGIAEGCAVSMAAGLAKQGMIPVFAVYSTFLQRSYDMLIHDVALEHLPVVLGVDRAGLVGDDGETHHGVFDVAYLDTIPYMKVYAPASFAELRSMVKRAVEDRTRPSAIRYPRGGEGAYQEDHSQEPCVVLRQGSHLTIGTYGMEVNEVLAAAEQLHQQGIEAEILKWNVITPLDCTLLVQSVGKTGHFLMAEECAQQGSVGVRALAALEQAGIKAKTALVNCTEGFVTHGSVARLKQDLMLDAQGLVQKAKEVVSRGQ